MSHLVPAETPNPSCVAEAALCTERTANDMVLPDAAALQELPVLPDIAALQELHAFLEMHLQKPQPSEVRVALCELVSAVERVTTGDQADCRKADKTFNPEETKPVHHFHVVAWESFAFFILFPSLILLACLLLGALLASVEAWTWQTGFEYIVSTACGLATPLGNANNVNPATFLGRIMAGVFGVWALGSTGIVCGWASNTMVVNFIVSVMSVITGKLNIKEEGTAAKKVAALVLSIFVLVPFLLSMFVLLCACLLSLSERWALADGIFYILANVVGLPNPLVRNSPATYSGKVFDAIISAWCLVFGSIIIGLTSNLPLPEWVYGLKNRCCSRDRRLVSPNADESFP